MSITKIEVRSAQGDLLTLELDDVSGGYVVEDVDGLDPVKATVASSNFATMDGQQYHASSLDIRNIKITLGFEPDFSLNQTIRSLRTTLYRYFMPKSEIFLKFFMEDGLTVTASGRVESCEAPLFVQEPQLVCSIICFDPDFVDLVYVEHTDLLTTDTVPKDINVIGSVSTGFGISMKAYSTMSDFTIYHTAPSGLAKTMQFSVPLIVNDLVIVTTNPGEKTITLTRDGVKTSILYAISPQSEWIQLEPGLNKLRVYSAAVTPSPVFVAFRNRYGGL